MIPYMHISLSQEDTLCILLQVVDGELKDVAKGKILQPENRMMHNRPMAPGVHRVQISLVISGYNRVEPPIQPPDTMRTSRQSLMIVSSKYAYGRRTKCV